jgi:hypothetical protein
MRQWRGGVHAPLNNVFVFLQAILNQRTMKSRILTAMITALVTIILIAVAVYIYLRLQLQTGQSHVRQFPAGII